MESETASVREAILHAFFGKYSCKEGKKPSSVCVLFSFLFFSLPLPFSFVYAAYVFLLLLVGVQIG
jgi:hypothetical protein